MCMDFLELSIPKGPILRTVLAVRRQRHVHEYLNLSSTCKRPKNYNLNYLYMAISIIVYEPNRHLEKPLEYTTNFNY